MAGWPGSVILLPAAPDGGLVLIAIGGLWLCLWRLRWRAWGLGLIGLGALIFTQGVAPHILVDEQGRLFAVQDGKGDYVLSSRRRAKFSGETWLRRIGQGSNSTPVWPKKATKEGSLSCDNLGCIYINPHFPNDHAFN